jgi:hypothetical protein
MRWDPIGRASGPTSIGGTVIPEGAEVFIPIAEPEDIETCPSCAIVRREPPLVSDQELFRQHLERHLGPPFTVRYRNPEIEL